MGRLDGQVAIVTGGAQGIGGATARRLAEEGARVLVADIDMSTADANVAGIREAGGTAESVRADIGRHDDILAMIDRATELWGRLDILVNNGYTPTHGRGRGTAVDVTEDEWDVGMNLLVKSIFLGAKYAVPEMEKTGAGSIVNMASVHSLLMAPGKLVYEAGKSAVVGVTKQMATDFGPMGIRVNAICPGHIATERIEAAAAENPSGTALSGGPVPAAQGWASCGRSQCGGVPLFRGGVVYHGALLGGGRWDDGAVAGGLWGEASRIRPGEPGHHPAALGLQRGDPGNFSNFTLAVSAAKTFVSDFCEICAIQMPF